MTQTSTAAAQTVTLECSCKVCGVNAAKIGKTLPLRADVPARMVQAMSATTDRKARHGLVYIAHDPNAVSGAAARKVTGIVPA